MSGADRRVLELSLAVVLSGMACGRMKDSRYVLEGQNYVESVVPIIAKDWDVNEITGRADRSMLEALSPDKMRELMATCAKDLGTLKQLKTRVASSTLTLGDPYTGKQASYSVRLECEKADADLRISVVKTTGNWRISSFWIDILQPVSRTQKPDSWTPEAVQAVIEACKEGGGGAVPSDDATRACTCIADEMQRRWATPREYSQDTERHNQQLADSGAVAKCRGVLSRSESARD